MLLTPSDLAHRAIALVDRNVGVGVAVCVRVSNVNSSKRLPANYAWALGIRPVERFEERVVFVGVSVRPTVYGDGLDVLCRIESSAGKHAAKLVADVALEDIEGRTQQFPSSRLILFLTGKPGFARGAQQMQQAGLLG